MKTDVHPLHRLPELPVELFELSGKLEYSETAPVITIKPKPVIAEAPDVTALAQSKASHTISRYFVWVIYPHVICYPFPDLVATARLKMENTKPDLRENETDPWAIANVRRYYKLSKLGRIDLSTPYGCRVQYGPWTAQVTQTESCFDGIPDYWELSSSVIDLSVQWYGEWEDIPSVPNLTVVMGSLGLNDRITECCGGFKWCATTQSCIPNQLTCHEKVPI